MRDSAVEVMAFLIKLSYLVAMYAVVRWIVDVWWECSHEFATGAAVVATLATCVISESDTHKGSHDGGGR